MLTRRLIAVAGAMLCAPRFVGGQQASVGDDLLTKAGSFIRAAGNQLAALGRIICGYSMTY